MAEVLYTKSLRLPGVVDGSELDVIPKPDGTWKFRALSGGSYVDVIVPDDLAASAGGKLVNAKPPEM